MTSEPPAAPARHHRPGAAARGKALGVTSAAAPPVVPAAPVRESLRDSLSRIPDLVPDEPITGVHRAVGAGAGVAVAAPPASAPVARAAPAMAAPVSPPKGAPDDRALGTVAPDDVAPAPAPLPEPSPAGRRHRTRTSPPPPRPWWRRTIFAVLVIGLVASIPVLGYVGKDLIADSTAGEFDGDTLAPEDPGFEAAVDPTPTAAAIHLDDEGNPTAVTFLALSGASGGGSVIFVPLDTQVSEPSYGVDRLRTAYAVVADRPTLAKERLASQVGRLLNVGVDEIIELPNASWTQLVAPVAPLEIDSPEPVDLGFGLTIPSGPTTLTADQVGRYLEVSLPGQSDLNRLFRHEVVWSAWLEQVAASGADDAVPGESSAGIGKFARWLAAGPVSYDTLPVDELEDQPGIFEADRSAVSELITDAVAAPTAAVPGSRFTVRLLNGVEADPIPNAVLRQVVARGGAVTILGNGPSFGTDETTVVYANPDDEDVATLMAESLGATGKVRLDREAPDTVDLTIVLGRDVLGDT